MRTRDRDENGVAIGNTDKKIYSVKVVTVS